MTDADLVLRRIPADATFPGLGSLDRDAAAAALLAALDDPAGASGRAEATKARGDRLEKLAGGVVAVVDAAMEQAVRAVTVERGVDPRGLALVAFGGAGPLHACALAESLGMPAVVVPPRAGVFSAVGLLCSPRQRELVRSWPTPSDHGGIEAALRSLGDEARAAVGGRDDVEVRYSLDCRYQGQSHELTVGSVEAFPEEHRRRNGYARMGAPIEVVAVRARARRPAALDPVDLPAPERKRVVGPAVAAEPDCTMWVPEGWIAEPGPAGAWLITRSAEPG